MVVLCKLETTTRFGAIEVSAICMSSRCPRDELQNGTPAAEGAARSLVIIKMKTCRRISFDYLFSLLNKIQFSILFYIVCLLLKLEFIGLSKTAFVVGISLVGKSSLHRTFYSIV